MDNDTRIPLPTNVEFRLSILDEKGTPHDFTIKDEIARGGSCIVYSGVWNDTIGTEPPTSRDVIIKEFYPRSLKEPINRDNDSHELLIGGIPADKNHKFLLERDRFNRGQRMCAAYANKHPDFVLSQLVCSGSANNTSYAVLLRGEGTVLSKLDRSTINLTDAIEIAESLCDAIGSIHDYKSSVYLDCKPDNISVSGNRVKLFDFDTMQPIDRISVPSFSVGFSAPEQIEEDEFGFIDTRNIGVHSDIFAIGATFFWLLTGKNPYEAGLKIIQSETSWIEAIDLKDTTDALQDEGFKSELVRLMRSVLETDPKIRQQTYGFNKPAIKLKNDFTHLKGIAKSAPDRRGFERTNENIDAGVRTIIDHIDKTVKGNVSDSVSSECSQIVSTQKEFPTDAENVTFLIKFPTISEIVSESIVNAVLAGLIGGLLLLSMYYITVSGINYIRLYNYYKSEQLKSDTYEDYGKVGGEIILPSLGPFYLEGADVEQLKLPEPVGTNPHCIVKCESVNGAILKQYSITNDDGGSQEISPPILDGYRNSPFGYIWNGKKSEEISFRYRPLEVKTQTLVNNEWWWRDSKHTGCGIKYTVVVDFGNRTETTVDAVIRWTNILNKNTEYNGWTGFNMSIGDADTGDVRITEDSIWSDVQYYQRTAEKEVTITITGLSPTTTTVSYTALPQSSIGQPRPDAFSGTRQCPKFCVNPI